MYGYASTRHSPRRTAMAGRRDHAGTPRTERVLEENLPTNDILSLSRDEHRSTLPRHPSPFGLPYPRVAGKDFTHQEATRDIHITWIARLPLRSSLSYTQYQSFVHRLQQSEDEAGSQYVLQPVPLEHRDAVEPPAHVPIVVHPRVLRPRPLHNKMEKKRRKTSRFMYTYVQTKANTSVRKASQ
jgi:hypothetical protein